jgi:excisionase family DNA binding protein
MSASSNHRAGADQPSASRDVLSEPLLKVEDAAELLRVPRSTLYELVRSRHLPHIRVGRGLRFTRSDLAGWIQENTFH